MGFCVVDGLVDLLSWGLDHTLLYCIESFRGEVGRGDSWIQDQITNNNSQLGV